MRGMGEIEELNINEECVIESKSKIEELRHKEIISDRTARKQEQRKGCT